MIGVDMSEVRSFSADLGREAAASLPAARAVLQKGALNIKNKLRDEAKASGIPEARSLAGFITYETKELALGTRAEIGPTEGASGSFAFLYFGNSKNGPVLPDPGDALEAEVPALVRYLAKVAGGSL